MTTDTDLPELQDASDLPPSDGVLGVLVQAMDALPGSMIGVTLHVSGVIVTGQMIAISDYFTELAAVIESAASSPESTPGRVAVAAVFAELADDIRPADGAPLDDRAAPVFIHLRDARVMSPDTARSKWPPVLWRGRLDHVSAWSLGIPAAD